MKKLFRSRRDKVIGGVCGGLGNYLGIDPVIIRVIFVISVLFHGFGLLPYVILWIIVPEEPIIFPGESHQQPDGNASNADSNTSGIPDQIFSKSTDTGRLIAGIFLIGIGLLFLFHHYFYFINFRDIFPFGLIVLGVLLLLNSFKR